jgi:hypothetical protein
VQSDQLFVLLLFIREENCSHAQVLQNMSIVVSPRDMSTGNFSMANLFQKTSGKINIAL